jgi:hypothetical protein
LSSADNFLEALLEDWIVLVTDFDPKPAVGDVPLALTAAELVPAPQDLELLFHQVVFDLGVVVIRRKVVEP